MEQLACAVADESITFSGSLQGTLQVRLQPVGTERLLLLRALNHSSLQVFPDIELEQSLDRQAGLFEPPIGRVSATGHVLLPGSDYGRDWLHCSPSSVHQLDDFRSPYLQSIRRSLLEAANVGYDRCGHFGLMYCSGQSPNYGDGGFLAPSVDVRHLHINWVFLCQQLATY